MADIIDISDVATVSKIPPGSFLNYQIYNGLDCCLTHEILDALLPQLTPDTRHVYEFEKSLQAPLLEMAGRGILVDKEEKSRAIARLKIEAERYLMLLQRFAEAVWDKPLNPASPKQLHDFFYVTMRIPPIRVQVAGGKWEISTNRDALEKMQIHFYARPICLVLLAWRDVNKKIQTLSTGCDPDGRFRTSFNIASTVTGRLSSSENPFGTGGNLQNVTGELRKVYVADPGKKLAYLDLAQAESRGVGLLAYFCTGISTYLDACEAGDLHTVVAKLCWPSLPWTGNLKEDRAIAERPFYRMFTRRDLAKRGGHGCLTADHEVLTPEGWIGIADVTDGQPIMAWDWKTKRCKWEVPSHWTRKHYSGKLYNYAGRDYSMQVTADHRMPCTAHTNGKRVELPGEEAYKFGHYSLPVSATFEGGQAEVSINQALLHAAFQADGHWLPSGSVQFGFSKKRKIDRLVSLLGERKFTLAVDCRGETRIYIPKKEVDFVFEGKKAGPYLLTWPQDVLTAFATELVFWDGTTMPTFKWIYGKDREHMFWLHTILKLTGHGSSYHPNHGHDCARTSVSRRKLARISSMKVTSKIADEMVYCPTVPSAGFLVRRHNTVMFSLNSNYFGQPPTIARNLKIDVSVARDFQYAYFKAFPEISFWHDNVKQQLLTTGSLTTPFRRFRQFFGRPQEGSTIRAAIAHSPQSMIADMVDTSLRKVWRELPQVELLIQVHDAIVIQYPIELEMELLPKVQACMQQNMPIEPFEVYNPILKKTITAPARNFVIGSDVQTGWNWAKGVSPEKAAKYKIAENPYGMEDWKGRPDDRSPPPKISPFFLLNRPAQDFLHAR